MLGSIVKQKVIIRNDKGIVMKYPIIISFMSPISIPASKLIMKRAKYCNHVNVGLE